ncbi:MAG: hypothetical protein ACK4P1_11720, partial [Aggregatilineales bacterium]
MNPIVLQLGGLELHAFTVWIGLGALGLRTVRLQDAFRRGVAIGVVAVWAHVIVHSLFDKLFVNNLFLHFGAMLGLIGTLVAAVSSGTQKA